MYAVKLIRNKQDRASSQPPDQYQLLLHIPYLHPAESEAAAFFCQFSRSSSVLHQELPFRTEFNSTIGRQQLKISAPPPWRCAFLLRCELQRVCVTGIEPFSPRAAFE